MIIKSRIALDGPYPPPYGGISVHIKRFVSFLEEKKIRYTLFYSSSCTQVQKNFKTLKFRTKFFFLITGRYSLVHTHTTGFRERLLFPLLKITGKKIVITLHGSSTEQQYRRASRVMKALFLFQLKQYDHLIVVNYHIKEFLINHGIKEKKISVIPAFIFPRLEEYSRENLPDSLITLKKRHNFLITANAYKITFHNSHDLYGIDLCIELTKGLVERGYKDVGFLFVLPDIGDYDYFHKMKNLIAQYELEEHFHFHTELINYAAVLHISELFIRPTSIDGYGVSISEALYLGVPAIASDVCRRAEGTLLFQNRNINDLFEKTVNVIENYDRHRQRLKGQKYVNYGDAIVDVYEKVLDIKL